MKRMLAALAALTIAVSAHAKVLVVADIRADASSGIKTDLMGARLIQGAVDMLDRFGVSYTLVYPSQTRTEYCRTGDQVWNGGSAAVARSSGAYVEHFDAVIHLNWGGSKTTEGYWPQASWGYYPDSMTLAISAAAQTALSTATLPTVPQLFVFGANNSGSSGSGLTVYADRSNPACSTGVKLPASYGAGTSACSPVLNYLIPRLKQPAISDTSQDRTTRWLSTSQEGGTSIPGAVTTPPAVLILQAAQPNGGARGIIGSTAFGGFYQEAWKGIPCGWCDSLSGSVPGAQADTVVLWERLMKNLGTVNSSGTNATVAREVFVNVMGGNTNGAGRDSALNRVAQEFEAPLFLMALAHLDSLTNGRVFQTLKTQVAALVIKGAFQRNDYRYPAGIRDNASNSDSAVFKATLDSLETLKIKSTVVVDVDSIGARPNEVTWWKKLSLARFDGETTVGVGGIEGSKVASTNAGLIGDTTSLGTSRAASSTLPVDIWGRFRVRTYYGPGTGASQDTSIFTQKSAADSAVAYWFGAQRVSRSIIAPFDDYSPKNITWAADGPDSLAWVITKLGKIAVVSNVKDADGDPNQLKTNRDLTRGFWPYQGVYQSDLGGPPLEIVGTNGHSISGSFLFDMPTYGDTAIVARTQRWSNDAAYPHTAPIPMRNMSRFWGGFAHNLWRDYDVIEYETQGTLFAWQDRMVPTTDVLYPQRRGNVLVIHASDLSGPVAQNPGSWFALSAAMNPRRPGWWTVKWLNNQFQTINYLAGRNIVSWGYPEDIIP